MKLSFMLVIILGLAKQLVCVCRGRVWAAIVHGCNGATVWEQKSKNGLLSSGSPKTVWVEWWEGIYYTVFTALECEPSQKTQGCVNRR